MPERWRQRDADLLCKRQDAGRLAACWGLRECHRGCQAGGRGWLRPRFWPPSSGLLSLLSPCSALLLPAFFAYAFQSRGELVGRTAVFYLGLCATLVPLGMGISAASALVYGHRSTLITVSGLLI